MKINKKNHRHWIILFKSAAYILLTIPLRHLGKKRKVIILYGHKLNGNLKALLDDWQQSGKNYELYFATMDPDYYQQLAVENVSCLNLCKFKDVITVSKSAAIITDHGLHTLVLYQLLTGIKFIDVWHGVPFKGFDKEDFKHLHKHDQIWTSSTLIKKMYIDKFGFAKDKMKVTGYGRVDQFVNKSLNKAQIIKQYGIKPADKYVLIAPTWKQQDKSRSLLPFNTEAKDFFEGLDQIAAKQKAVIIVRTHLNSSEDLSMDGLKNIQFMPFGKYPVAEDFLYIADLLVTDWSSIGFDYLPLDRPTIFLDVPAPFAKGFSVGPEHRFGKVVSSYDELKKYMNDYLTNPATYKKAFAKNIANTKELIYGNTLDGKSTQRYQQQITELFKR